MDKFVDNIIKFKWLIVILIPIVVIALSVNLKNLGFEGSYRVWFGEDSKILKDYDSFRSTFGNDEALIITFKDEKGILTPKALGVVERLTEKLWQTPYIARVDSITNFQYIHNDEEYPEDVIVEDLFEDVQGLTQEQIDSKKVAIKGENIIGRVISNDFKTTTISARLTPNASDDPYVSLELNAIAKELVKAESESGYTFYLNGSPVLNSAFIQIAQADGALFTPLVIVISMVLLFIIFRRIDAMFMSIAVVIFTFMIVLSIQVMLGFKLNNFTANMPVFVVAIGIADAMHILWIYTIGRKKGLGADEAIHYSLNKNFMPVLFTSLTTAVGFASLSISNVIPVKTLGIATASAALLAFVMTILFIPAVLSIIKPNIKLKDKIKSNLAKKYTNFIINNDRKILFITATIFVVLAFGITLVKVDSNTVRYFKKEVEFRASTEFMQENIGGPMMYEVVIDSKEKDGIKDPAFLRTVEKFHKELKEKFDDARHIGSLMNAIKKFNLVLNGSKEIPDDKNLVAQYLLLYSLSLPQGMELNDQMDINERLWRSSVSMNIVDTSKDLEMIEWIESWWQKSPYSASVEGQTVMFAHMQSDVTETLLYSITLAITLVSIMMLLIFRNFKLLPLYILPNIVPIALVIGAMGYLGVSIDLGVAIAGAIVIGIAVDDTIHFFAKYFEAKKRGDSFEEALEYVMHYAGSAIIFTTIILTMSFMVFVFSSFNPNFYFAIVTSIALVIAMVTDLVLLPAMLSLLAKRKS
ncbi:MAG: MMPL family transporter [Helicobacteraceae bacterium]|nr:MMPL family transporter [Helicobacteraceae bacterium]